MNLNALSTPAMLSNSDAWLTNKAVRASLEAHPLGMAILGELAGVHDDLNEALSQRGQIEMTLVKMTEELQWNDGEHDSFARGLYGFLGAFAEVAESPRETAALLEARTLLFPDDLEVVRRSFVDEHGAVLELERRMTDPVRALLRSTKVGQRTLLDIYDGWIEAGKRLGKLAQERARLRASLQRSGELSDTIDTKSSRNNWIRVSHLFLGVVELLPLEDEDRRAILAPLRKDIEDAQRARARAVQGSGAGGPEPETTEPETTEPETTEPAAD